MSVTAERSRPAQVEPDRLAGFPAPRETGLLVGHDSAFAELAEALRSGRMHHAWLIVGPEGVGKATLAYEFARFVLAGGEKVGAEHPVARKIAALSHPNLLVIRRSWVEKSKRYSQWIGVDEVRRLRSFLGHSAGEGGWRLVIVDRADEMNQNAANALLKALEEPPVRTLFLLVSSAEGKLPVTIRSRARTLRVGPLGREELERAARAALVQARQEPDAKTLATALALSQGSVRRALELASNDGVQLYDEIAGALAALPEIDGTRLHRQAERLSGQGDPTRLDLYMALLLGFIERLIRFTATGEGASEGEERLAKRLVSPAGLVHWAEAWEAISQSKAATLELNLDRGLLVLETWFRLQSLARDHTV